MAQTLDPLKKSNDALTEKISGLMDSVGENSRAISYCKEYYDRLEKENKLLRDQNQDLC